MSQMMLAHTKLLVPKTLPIKREAASSAARVVMPETKTVKYKYFFIDIIIPVGNHFLLDERTSCG